MKSNLYLYEIWIKICICMKSYLYLYRSDLYLYEIYFLFLWNHTYICMKSTFDLYEIRFVFTLILLIPDARLGPGILHLRRSSWDCRNLLGHTWVNEWWYNMGNNNQMSDAIWTTTIKRVIQYRPGARIDSDNLSLFRYLSFSVLHNRHLSDIWVICQKCQFEVCKGCKGEIKEQSWFHGSLSAWYCCITTCFREYMLFLLSRLQWDNYAFLFLIMSQIRAFWVLFRLRLYSDIRDFTQILLRYLTKNWPFKPLKKCNSETP